MSLTDDLSDGFFRKVKILCANLGCKPEDMLKVWFSESIGMYADQQNQKGADAWGINQMTLGNLRKRGFAGTGPEYLTLTAEQQLPFVEGSYAPFAGKLTSAVRIYQLNFLPATLGKEKPDGTIAAPDSDNPDIRKAYNDNKGYFDSANKGFITLADLQAAIDGSINNSHPNARKGVPLADRWKEILARLNATAGTAVAVPPGLIGKWAVTTPDGSFLYVFDFDGDVQWALASQPNVIDETAGAWTVDGGRLKITWKNSTEFWPLPLSPGGQAGEEQRNDGFRGDINARKVLK